jgi:TonB-dependent starch-binding outer membrane protein SusC
MRKFIILLLCLCATIAQLSAQNRTVTGKVTDEAGKAIENASVIEKGTTNGTRTSNDGSFSLSVTSNAKSLLISSINFTTQQFVIGRDNILNVKLQITNANLTEIVVVAYGTKKKSDVTGAVSSIGGGDLENKPFSSVDKALQGGIAGLQSTAGSGAPGAAQDIRIRGVSSINAGNAPLWVLDGVIVNSGDASRLQTTSNLLSTLNPNDIENITVLKDAASTAAYGSRGANGVILVTTKKGKSGKTKFRFDTEIGYNTIAYQSERNRSLNAQEYLSITKEGLINSGATPAQIATTLTSLGDGTGTDFNWLNALTRQGNQKQYNLSASGGTEKSTFYVSGGYFKQEGTTIASDLTRQSALLKVTNQATDRLFITAGIDGGVTKQNTPLAGGAFGNPILSSYFILPTFSAYKADGSLNYLTPQFPTSAVYNTLATIALDKRKLNGLSLRGNISADYKILKNLLFRSSYGADYNTLEEEQYNNPFYGDGVALLPGSPTSGTGILYNPSTSGRVFNFYTRYFNYTFTNTLNYRANITKSADVYANLKLGYESQLSKGYFNNLQGRGFPLTTSLQQAASTATPTTASATISNFSFVSQFALLDFNFRDRYVLSGSFRRDGSSRFGENNKYGNFWSIGASWNVDKEQFLANANWITQLKLRASYGKLGNAQIGNYDYFPGYGYGANYNSTPGSFPNNVGNLDLTWEVNKPLDVGIDIGLFKNRITITADYYKRVSSELLLDVPLSPTSGFLSVRKNIGALENKGVEFAINFVPIRTKDFSWDVNFNYSRNINKVTSLPEKKDILNGLFIYREGFDVQSYFMRKYAGVDPANGDPLWFQDSTLKTSSNVYSTAQRLVSNSASPKYFGAITNTFTYKGITLEAQFYYSGGNYSYDAFNSFYIGAGANPTFNKTNRVLDRWQKPGDLTNMPKYIYGGNKSFQSASTFYLNDATYVRLRNLQLGYLLPTQVAESIKLNSLFFYVRGTNLFTWVKDKNQPFDPEQGAASRSNLNELIPRTVSFGINVGF